MSIGELIAWHDNSCKTHLDIASLWGKKGVYEMHNYWAKSADKHRRTAETLRSVLAFMDEVLDTSSSVDGGKFGDKVKEIARRRSLL